MALKRVTVGVRHEGCWTSEVKDGTVTINLEVYPDRGYLRSWLISSSRELRTKMREHKSVRKVNRVYETRESTLLDFLNVFHGSVAGLLYSREVLILGNYNRGGEEFWTFVTTGSAMNEILNELSSLGKITTVSEEDYVPYFPSLTEMERRVFWMALNRGYLNYPRDVEAEDLARVLGVSKVTFLYHWRNAQKKIMKYVSKNINI
ncbi:helix-turn-helix domain-containing protein [Metallosphaera hakonensis]|uniref:Bacterio-opsin activator n=1 Tax=Metallosphaera hakonensis JCM 8857 = DSM 7519 TaxID=1293036 RepID=A0A2U9IR41_9CREN|nr:helix-turn-helix domain-containing protein [Metallosphaera hakonensis]AWR98511.1 bacterio-opsin activator [Metallosphaera hakonensis JCM 8857 = DSM 7519]